MLRIINHPVMNVARPIFALGDRHLTLEEESVSRQNYGALSDGSVLHVAVSKLSVLRQLLVDQQSELSLADVAILADSCYANRS